MRKSEFAAANGWSPSYVTRLAKAGRLVLNEEGLIDAPASLERLRQTGGTRPDVALRHAGRRGLAPLPEGELSESEKVEKKLHTSRAIKAHYDALNTKIDYEEKIGNLIPREDVEAAFRFVGGAVRAALEIFPGQTAPLVVSILDLDEAHETLVAVCQDALQAIVGEIDRRRSGLLKEPHG